MHLDTFLRDTQRVFWFFRVETRYAVKSPEYGWRSNMVVIGTRVSSVLRWLHGHSACQIQAFDWVWIRMVSLKDTTQSCVDIICLAWSNRSSLELYSSMTYPRRPGLCGPSERYWTSTNGTVHKFRCSGELSNGPHSCSGTVLNLVRSLYFDCQTAYLCLNGVQHGLGSHDVDKYCCFPF